MKIKYSIRPEPWLRKDYAPIYHKGDKVICIPGFLNDDAANPREQKFGGMGYKENKIITVANERKGLYQDDNYYVLWPVEDGDGIYNYATRLATQEDIEKYGISE